MMGAAGKPDRGRFVVISSPSGGGKTTLIKHLLERNESFTYSVSATTRPRRGDEENGAAYWFYTIAEFLQKRNAGDLLEWEEVYGDFYGTPKTFATEAVAEGKTVLFDLDVKGALRLKAILPETLLIFISPPSLEILESRLRDRKTESEARVQKRLAAAGDEIAKASQFDFTVVNDDLNDTVKQIEDIIHNSNPMGVGNYE
ncbi:guanylate kinase [bacterium]|nr:guanylate kinase [bacterium]MBU1653101.1 guanylate kinase [bacterium]